ncbi:TRAP transporter small permease [Neobacillus sp. 114]|uniref:TRAP transporter small permease n=1 Tax=Neobacillus sp. 114 TaxID=3048535 RepID=UPI0024C3DCCB|nr:TRAP transporter small permease [Neobacillus sp. 114]
MLSKIITNLTRITKWIALITMAFMMLFIAFAVVSRMTFTPILGDVEIVQLGMVVLIMCGLAYTQQVDGHISIGLIVDKFPYKGQKIMDVIACLFNVIVTFVIAFIFIEVAINHMTKMKLSTSLLGIPYYPFDFLIILGFIMWGLEAFLKLIRSILAISQPIQNEKERDLNDAS